MTINKVAKVLTRFPRKKLAFFLLPNYTCFPLPSAQEVWDNVGAAETYWIPVYEQNKEAAFDPEVIENVMMRDAPFYLVFKSSKLFQNTGTFVLRLM